MKRLVGMLDGESQGFHVIFFVVVVVIVGIVARL